MRAIVPKVSRNQPPLCNLSALSLPGQRARLLIRIQRPLVQWTVLKGGHLWSFQLWPQALEIALVKADVAYMSASTVVRLCLCLALCMGVGFASGRATTPEIATWYAALAKPWWTPPDCVFPLVWSILYAMMGVSLWLFWETRTGPSRRWCCHCFLPNLRLTRPGRLCSLASMPSRPDC